MGLQFETPSSMSSMLFISSTSANAESIPVAPVATTNFITSLADTSSEDIVSALASELAWFILGFLAIQLLIYLGFLPRFRLLRIHTRSQPKGEGAALARKVAIKELCANAASGKHDLVLEGWEALRHHPLPLDALKDSAQSLALLAPSRLLSELPAHAQRFNLEQRFPKKDWASELASAVLEVVADDALGDELLQRLLQSSPISTRSPSSSCSTDDGSSSNSPRTITPPTSPQAGPLQKLTRLLASGDIVAATAFVRNLTKFQEGRSSAASSVDRHGLLLLLDGANGPPLPSKILAIAFGACLSLEDASVGARFHRAAAETGAKLTFNCIEPLLKLYAGSRDHHQEAIDLFEELQRSGLFASEGFCGSLLARCGDSENLLLAERLMEYLRTRSSLTLAIFKTLMRVYARCGRYDLACGVEAQVKDANLEPDDVMKGCLARFEVKRGSSRRVNLSEAADADFELRSDQASKARPDCSEASPVVQFNMSLKRRIAQGQLNEALAAFRKGQVQPDVVTYNTLLEGLASSWTPGTFKQMQELLHSMSNAGLRSDRFTVCALMKAVKRTSHSKEVFVLLSVLDDVDDTVILGDDIVFHSVLEACIVHQQRLRLTTLVDRYLTSPSLVPSVHLSSTLIRACGVLGRRQDCDSLWREMVETRGQVPTHIALGCMLDSLVRCGALTKAIHLFREWKSKVPPSIVLFALLFKGCATAGAVEEAQSLHRELREDNVEMNLISYTSLIDVHTRSGQVKEAKRLFTEMRSEGIEPNVVTYSTLLKGFCSEGNMNEAASTFREMLDRGLSADTVTFNTLLDGCAKNDHFELADMLLREMKRRDVRKSHVTISIMIKLASKRIDLDGAFEATRGEGASLPSLDAQVAKALVQACFHAKQPLRALSVLEEMCHWPGQPQPDDALLSKLVLGLATSGHRSEAVDLAILHLQSGKGTASLSALTLKQLLQKLRPGEDLYRSLKGAISAAGMKLPH
mmetsp:Transcript_57766/g.122888  ORF Transcript_57766/g.122888 Transcript_57766/m.122888 type:complete len:979 (+) Transcript_57766:141-3077(+)